MSVRGRSIAIVDDDVGMRKALERLLRVAEYEPHTFGSAEEFLSSAAPEQHACVILDISLPGMSGLDLSRCLEAGNIHLPTIFITAQERNWENKQVSGPVSHNVCLFKPFQACELLGTIESALSNELPSH
jgi:two-component system, LuxR family, response regulator FixJ